MSRYIDADKLQESFKELHGGKRSLLIDTEPTADVVEVVRCKDCKYGEVDNADFPNQYFCNHHGCDWNDENHFCSYGERAEE